MILSSYPPNITWPRFIFLLSFPISIHLHDLHLHFYIHVYFPRREKRRRPEGGAGKECERGAGGPHFCSVLFFFLGVGGESCWSWWVCPISGYGAGTGAGAGIKPHDYNHLICKCTPADENSTRRCWFQSGWVVWYLRGDLLISSQRFSWNCQLNR